MMVARAIPVVVSQHVEDCGVLRNLRSTMVRAPHVQLHHLERLDERIEAHLDGLVVAGNDGMRCAVEALARPDVGGVFVVAALAISMGDQATLTRLMALAEASHALAAGLVSALGWVPATALRGIVAPWLSGPGAFALRVGLAACGTHRVDPGRVLSTSVSDDDPALRACALRLIGDLGSMERLPACRSALETDDDVCRIHAIRALALLGDVDLAVGALMAAGPLRTSGWETLRLVLKITTSRQSDALLSLHHDEGQQWRDVFGAVAAAGDPGHVPWLIEQMHQPQRARLAAESIRTITGLKLDDAGLVGGMPPEDAFGPTESAGDDDVSLDADENLPWPDIDGVAAWWRSEASQFVAGRRYLLGCEPTVTHCRSILSEGTQPHRRMASEYLALSSPGRPLINIAAPAKRQNLLL